jgi:hypothetical protein
MNGLCSDPDQYALTLSTAIVATDPDGYEARVVTAPPSRPTRKTLPPFVHYTPVGARL